MKKLKKYGEVIILAVASFLTHFIFFGYPAQTVFDEVHFGKFISGYFSGEYFFDIHPPLAKLLISVMGFIGGYRPTIDFGVIGESFTNSNFIWLRLLPTLAGALLPIVIYYLCRTLNFSRLASFTAGALIILENSLLVQSRFILLDSLLLLFGFGSLLLYFLYQKYPGEKRSLYFLTAALLLSAFAFSIKWTGISFFALIVGLECIHNIQKKAPFKEWLAKVLFFFGISFIVYFLSFGVHFALLQKNGPGKDFMSPGFQKTLLGNAYQNDESVVPLGLFGKFVELNHEMYSANKRLDATHPYGSKWYTWSYMKRPIYYWNQSPEETTKNIEPDTEGKIYLIGNPFIYWLSGLSLIIFIFYVLFLGLTKKETIKKNWVLFVFLFAGFFGNLLPFIFISRVMFLYHYFSSLIFAVLILSFLIDQKESPQTKKKTVIIILLISAVTFFYFAPLSYGLPLTQKEQSARFWFSTWQ